MENDLKFAGVSPVVINYNGKADDLYAPITCSSCDVTIVDKSILEDLYTPYKDDIVMHVEIGQEQYTTQVTVTNAGSVSTMGIWSDVPWYHEIYQRDSFFTDGDGGDFYFKGIVKNSNGLWRVVLKYDYTDKVWVDDNTYLLNINGNGVNDQVFYYNSTLYKVSWDGTSHYISEWTGSAWGTPAAYTYVDNGVTHDCAYGTDQIIHYIDGTIELLFSHARFTWDNTNKRWLMATSYTSGNSSYTGMYGGWYQRVRKADGTVVDACVANGLDGEDWVVELNRTSGTFTKLVKLQDSYDIDNIFTDDNGYLYCVKSSGKVLYWSWETNDWFEWITFTGNDFVADTFALDYVIPNKGNVSKKIVVKYMYNESTREMRAMYLQDFTPPTIRVERIPTGETEYRTLFTGYMVPNTFSQAVTQNLDQITVTAIDFLSILKSVTIDKLFTKPATVTYGDIICKALSYAYLNQSSRRMFMVDHWLVYVEDCMSYGGDWDGTNGLFDLKCQVSNFWDESGQAATVYEVIEELLRPFCMRIVYDPSEGFIIYNVNHIPESGDNRSWFITYWFNEDGSYEFFYANPLYTEPIWHRALNYGTDWISNNVSDATIDIDTTYDKVTGTANTCPPNYSKMAIDLVDYYQTDKYDYGWLNVQRNKTKGYVKRNNNVTTDTADRWFYLWNGAYVNPDYDLESWNGYVNWFMNCNQAYEYMNNTHTLAESDHGSILNFYGGANNPTATGKTQSTEKAVEIKKRITAYAADNAVPPEFLELSDLDWEGHVYNGELRLTKKNTSNTKFGDGIVMDDSDWIIYHQEYRNITMNTTSNPVIELDMTRSFSRTGIDIPIQVMNNNTTTGNTYNIFGNFTGCSNADYFPQPWNAENVIVNSIYFRRYAGSGTIRVKPVWDSTRVDMYVKTSDDRIFQFNGKEWVEDTEVKESNAFHLQKLMNFEHLFHTDTRYNVIETSDGQHYSLTDEPFVYYTKTYSGEEYVDDGDSGTPHESGVYNTGVFVPVSSCSDGRIAITLPTLDDANPVVYVDIYNSTMLGMTGSDDIGGAYTGAPFYYALGGGEYKGGVYIDFLPKNVSHVKAEHVDLKITVTVPDSNLGQMFPQSDIEYGITSGKNYVEEYKGPTFEVNTKHPLVASSFSYILFDNNYADPGEFIINGIGARPECYTVQAYFNWLNVIRKIYTKTIKPTIWRFGSNPNSWERRDVYNYMTFIKSPEVGENPMMVVSSSYDVKTGRNTIVAVECHNLEVENVNQFTADELPHRARNERWNLPTAK